MNFHLNFFVFGVFCGGPERLRPGLWVLLPHSWLAVFFGYPGTLITFIPRPRQ
jgi:hypothetical protein